MFNIWRKINSFSLSKFKLNNHISFLQFLPPQQSSQDLKLPLPVYDFRRRDRVIFNVCRRYLCYYYYILFQINVLLTGTMAAIDLTCLLPSLAKCHHYRHKRKYEVWWSNYHFYLQKYCRVKQRSRLSEILLFGQWKKKLWKNWNQFL